jgi:hypothetical protein
VLYNGRAEWHAPINAADCFLKPPTGMARFRPQLEYLLLDERRLQQHPLAAVRNFADAIFRMEASHTPKEVIAVTHALNDLLRAPELDPLRSSLQDWRKSLLQRRAPASIIKEINPNHNIFEDIDMLAELGDTWEDMAVEDGRQQGMRQGWEKGLEKGKKEACLAIARNLLSRGIPPEDVMALTGISREDIQGLLH